MSVIQIKRQEDLFFYHTWLESTPSCPPAQIVLHRRSAEVPPFWWIKETNGRCIIFHWIHQHVSQKHRDFVNAFLLGWHDWVCHMARCWKSFLSILQSCNSFSAKVDFLLGSFPYHTYWTTMSTDGTSQPANGRISFPHCSSCTWRLSTLSNHGSAFRVSKVNLQSFIFLEDKGESLETHIFGMQKLPIFLCLHHNGSQARHLSVCRNCCSTHE